MKDKGDAGRRKKRCHINTPRIGCILAQAHMSVGQSPGPVRHLGASEPSASREPRRHTINFLRSRLQETTSRLKCDSSMQINKYIEAGKENTRSPGTTLGIEGSVLLLRVQVHRADPSWNLNMLMTLVSSVAGHLPTSKPSLFDVQVDTLLDMVCTFCPH